MEVLNGVGFTLFGIAMKDGELMADTSFIGKQLSKLEQDEKNYFESFTWSMGTKGITIIIKRICKNFTKVWKAALKHL